MITPRQFKQAAVAAAADVYVVTANQTGIVKGLTIHNAATTACTFTLSLFGVVIYTTRTLGPLESFECANAINKVGLAGDKITVTPSAAVNVLGSIIETAATQSS